MTAPPRPAADVVATRREVVYCSRRRDRYLPKRAPGGAAPAAQYARPGDPLLPVPGAAWTTGDRALARQRALGTDQVRRIYKHPPGQALPAHSCACVCQGALGEHSAPGCVPRTSAVGPAPGAGSALDFLAAPHIATY